MKIFLKQNVWDAALDRIAFLFDEFDEIIVSHSGGKDSTVIYNLALKVAIEKKRLPLKVQFVDQEAEWNSTIDHIREIMSNPQVEPLWLQIPIKIFNAVSKDDEWLMCWEEGKETEWIRPKEAISIKENTYGTDRFKELFAAFANKTFAAETKVACIGGVRAEESPVRQLGLTQAATYKHITWGKVLNSQKTHFTFYPIYDWSYTDVWKAIHSNKWAYNRHYDFLYMYGEPIAGMRVSNVHHETAVKSLFHLQEIDPVLYNALTRRIKGVDMAGKFKDDFFVHKLPYMFADWREYRDFLLEKIITDERRETFRAKFARTEKAYEGTRLFNALMREHIQCLLTNDYHFTKLDNFLRRPGMNIKHLKQMGEIPS
jgi:predicted phosphoadenosine phosphosulfate sulfurtransferase